MKIIYALATVLMIAIIGLCILEGAAEEHRLREARQYRALKTKIVEANVGSFVRLEGHGFLKTSRPARRAK